jgi:hypothetical protein
MTSSVHVTCLCSKNIEVLQLSCHLPVDQSVCSCNTCRYSTGVLYFSCLPLHGPPKLIQDLREYRSSEKLSRYFCSSCGSQMFVHVKAHDTWGICSGVVDRVVGPEQVSCLSLENVTAHEFVGDTTDGGLAICLADSDNQSVSLFLQGPDGPRFERPSGKSFTSSQRGDPPEMPLLRDSEAANQVGELEGGCHCGGVSFRLTRPNPTSRLCSSPWPDLIVPYHSASSANPEDIKWWLRGDDSKYLAGTCACRSCRLGSGSPIQAWAFVPKVNILQPNGQPLHFGIGTLRQVESSTDCFREFCDTCGATVFWHCRERPDLIDVSIGLLRATEGARAESWLDWWTERVSFSEEALDKKLIERLELGLKTLKATR